MIVLYLCTLYFYIVGIHLDVVGSDMCDNGWVYNSDTATCLQTTSGDDYRFIHGAYDPCVNKTGGEFRNISGRIVEFTEKTEPFLRNYLQFMKVPAAGVKLTSWLTSSLLRYNKKSEFSLPGGLRTYFVLGNPVPFQTMARSNPPIVCQVEAGPIEPPVCPRDVKLVSVSDRNATLSWSPGQLGRKVVVYITVQICDRVPLSCTTSFTKIPFEDVSLFQPVNYTVTRLQPKRMYKLDLQIRNENFKYIDCNVTLSLSTKEEPPICPRDVKLVSASDRNATLSWSPGQPGMKSVVKIEVHICVALSYEYFTTRIFEDKSPSQPMNYTVSGLQSNTKYKLFLRMFNDKFETKDCGIILALQTNEEPPICPRDVKLVSASDRNATLSWNPGQPGIKSIVKIDVHICVALSCEYFTTRIFEDKSRSQPMNYTVSGLQPNTKYKLFLRMFNDRFETKDCGIILALQTNDEKQGQESTAVVAGLAVITSVSLLVCFVLGIFLFRYIKQARKAKNSDIDKIVAKVMKQTTHKQNTKLQEHKSPETNSDPYLNVQVKPHKYETIIVSQDDHIYET